MNQMVSRVLKMVTNMCPKHPNYSLGMTAHEIYDSLTNPHKYLFKIEARQSVTLKTVSRVKSQFESN